MYPIDPINCFTFDTFLLKICCFAKLDMNRKSKAPRSELMDELN